MTITVTLPIPKRNPNARGHWAVLAKKHAADRAIAFAEARKVLGRAPAPKWKKVRLTITWDAGCEAHIPDADNCLGRIKGFQDGLVDAGWFIDDKHAEPVLIRTPNKPRGVTIACEEA